MSTAKEIVDEMDALIATREKLAVAAVFAVLEEAGVCTRTDHPVPQIIFKAGTVSRDYLKNTIELLLKGGSNG